MKNALNIKIIQLYCIKRIQRFSWLLVLFDFIVYRVLLSTFVYYCLYNYSASAANGLIDESINQSTPTQPQECASTFEHAKIGWLLCRRVLSEMNFLRPYRQFVTCVDKTFKLQWFVAYCVRATRKWKFKLRWRHVQKWFEKVYHTVSLAHFSVQRLYARALAV